MIRKGCDCVASWREVWTKVQMCNSHNKGLCRAGTGVPVRLVKLYDGLTTLRYSFYLLLPGAQCNCTARASWLASRALNIKAVDRTQLVVVSLTTCFGRAPGLLC